MPRRPGAVSGVELHAYTGTWSGDDPDAAFKEAVAASARLDPLPVLEQLAARTGVPVGALARYALVRWCSAGSEALLALGPRAVEQLWDVVEQAENVGTDEARLAAYERLRGMLSWLRAPLVEDAGRVGHGDAGGARGGPGGDAGA